MAGKEAKVRLKKELLRLKKEPTPLIDANPREDNLLEWFYVLDGPPDSPYAGGT